MLEKVLLTTLPVSDRAVTELGPFPCASPLTGKDVCRKGCSFGLLVVPGCEIEDDIDGRFLEFGRLAAGGAGGDDAIARFAGGCLNQEYVLACFCGIRES